LILRTFDRNQSIKFTKYTDAGFGLPTMTKKWTIVIARDH